MSASQRVVANLIPPPDCASRFGKDCSPRGTSCEDCRSFCAARRLIGGRAAPQVVGRLVAQCEHDYIFERGERSDAVSRFCERHADLLVKELDPRPLQEMECTLSAYAAMLSSNCRC